MGSERQSRFTDLLSLSEYVIALSNYLINHEWIWIIWITEYVNATAQQQCDSLCCNNYVKITVMEKFGFDDSFAELPLFDILMFGIRENYL